MLRMNKNELDYLKGILFMRNLKLEHLLRGASSLEADAIEIERFACDSLLDKIDILIKQEIEIDEWFEEDVEALTIADLLTDDF